MRRQLRGAAWVVGFGIVFGLATGARAQNAPNAFGGFQAQPPDVQAPGASVAAPSLPGGIQAPGASVAAPSLPGGIQAPGASVAAPSLPGGIQAPGASVVAPSVPGGIQAPGASVAAPSPPGSPGTYGYVQQNAGAPAGMSPNVYYSRTPMTTAPAYTYGAGYAGYTYPYSAAPGVTYGSPTYTAQGPTYGTPTMNGYPPTATPRRRVGLFRRLFGLGPR
jgi:hypothetical protein